MREAKVGSNYVIYRFVNSFWAQSEVDKIPVERIPAALSQRIVSYLLLELINPHFFLQEWQVCAGGSSTHYFKPSKRCMLKTILKTEPVMFYLQWVNWQGAANTRTSVDPLIAVRRWGSARCVLSIFLFCFNISNLTWTITSSRQIFFFSFSVSIQLLLQHKHKHIFRHTKLRPT